MFNIAQLPSPVAILRLNKRIFQFGNGCAITATALSKVHISNSKDDASVALCVYYICFKWFLIFSRVNVPNNPRGEKRVLCIFWITFIYQMCLMQIFSLSAACLLILLPFIGHRFPFKEVQFMNYFLYRLCLWYDI